MILSGRVVGDRHARFKHRWFGILEVETDDCWRISLYMSGSVAQWFRNGERVDVNVLKGSVKSVLLFDEYELFRFYHDYEDENESEDESGEYENKSGKSSEEQKKPVDGGSNERIKIWPVWEHELKFERKNAFDTKLYTYRLRAREAVYEADYEEIADLEQYHYASQKEFVAVWICEKCHRLIDANTKPLCDRCGTDEHVHILEIKGSTPASRFLIIEQKKKSGYEPRVLAYVRVDPPVPMMHRLLPSGEVVRNIRERVFEESWFSPSFSIEPKTHHETRSGAGSRLPGYEKWHAIETCNTAAARIARVVVHPDYRSDGIGKLAVNLAVTWIRERRIPEMRRGKKLVEVIAQMARFNPFFEKAGFKYLWDTSSGKPVLYLPLTDDAEERIEKFLQTDKYAKHRGKLFISRYGEVEKLSSHIIFENVTKIFSNEIDIKISPEVSEILQAFQVGHRRIQREVLRNLSIRISPGEILCVVGASGAGKTTFLRILACSAMKRKEEKCVPDSGYVKVPDNVRAAVIIPDEFEPEFGDHSIIEHVFRKCGDPYVAVEVLSACGLSDAILYRAKFHELSTGQKERAKLASVFAEKPNLIIIDEFAAHLDPLAAKRVARKVAEMCRKAGITLIVATHRREVKDALAPEKTLHIGYGTYFVRQHHRH